MGWSSASGFGALRATEPYDVCIVGAGFSGLVLAKQLVESGVRTLLLESGHGLIRWVVDKRLHDLAAYEFTGDTDYPLKRTKARAVGGNSNFWTGRSERFHPSDFELHPYTPPQSRWPFGYDELEPFYGRAEQTLRVRTGDFSEYAVPRSSDPPIPPSTDIATLKAILAEAGVTLDYSGTATPRRDPRFFRMNQEVLPAFRRSTNLALVRGANVTKLLAGEDGRIVGAETRAIDGTTAVARARWFIVTCGGIETPRLLLLSRCERFPEGIGNRHDRVGRGFNEHASVNFYGTIRHRRGTALPRHKIGRSHQFYDDFRSEGLGALLLNAIQSWFFPNHLLAFRARDLPRHAKHVIRRVIRPTLYLGTTIEMRICDENRVTLSETMKDRFGCPLAHLVFNYHEDDLRLLDRSRQLCLDLYARLGATDIREAETNFSMHHQGACRMGDNPATSVVNADLRVHESPNLFLCGAENFVTGSAMPPTLTIVALAHRLGDHLLERLRGA